MEIFERRSPMPVSAEELFEWHTRPGAFERLVAPWQRVKVVERHGGITDGARLVLQVQAGPLRGKWTAEHHDVVAGRQFADRQVTGPFKAWDHTHRFIPDGDDASILEDHLEYELPGGRVGRLLGSRPARPQLERVFRFRHERTRNDLERHLETRDAPRLKVAITGASGLIGRNLAAFLTSGGHEVVRVVRRRPAGDSEVFWDPAAGEIDAAGLEGVDAVVHTAGESIAGIWTASKKDAILRSRIDGTSLLARTLAGLEKRPRVLVSAAGVGWYGGRGDEVLTEDSSPGEGFLADVAVQWDASLDEAREAGIRVVTTRQGIVMTAAGGVLPLMLPVFRLGLGGRIGSGEQWFPWIALDDLLGIMLGALTDESLSGPVNAVAPGSVTNAVFTDVLGRVLGRPTVLAAPQAAVEKAGGQMARELLLDSMRVAPKRLEERSFRFLFPDLESALRFELGREDR
jgi:uncharacterized protein (TIGR01777 family)